MGADRYPLPWSKLTFDPQKDGYVTSMTKEQLDAAPKYSEEAALPYDENYRRKVSSYYDALYE